MLQCLTKLFAQKMCHLQTPGLYCFTVSLNVNEQLNEQKHNWIKLPRVKMSLPKPKNKTKTNIIYLAAVQTG